MTTTNQTTGNTGLVRNQDFERGATREAPPDVLIEKARGTDFISLYPTDGTLFVIPVIKDPGTGKHLIVSNDLAEVYFNDVKCCYMIPYMHQDGQINIWPLSTHKGPWCTSMLQILTQHGGKWLRVTADNEACRYRSILPSSSSPLAPPDWLETPLQIYERIPESSMITNHAHPVLARLRGEHLR